MARGMHGRGVCMAGAYVAGGMHGMHSKGACMAGGVCGREHAWQERWPLQQIVLDPTGMLSCRFLWVVYVVYWQLLFTLNYLMVIDVLCNTKDSSQSVLHGIYQPKGQSCEPVKWHGTLVVKLTYTSMIQHFLNKSVFNWMGYDLYNISSESWWCRWFTGKGFLFIVLKFVGIL